MNSGEITQSIFSGQQDDDLDAIKEAVRFRQKVIAGGKLRSLHVGDRVRFNSAARPQYLIGLEAVVTKVNQTRVKVRIEGDAGRFTGTTPTCPLSIIDKVAA